MSCLPRGIVVYSRMDYRDIITIEAGKRSGKPCIRGTRMTVTDVLEYLAGGMTHEELLADFPDLTEMDIRACLAFAARSRTQARHASGMKLLFDQNLSPQLPALLSDISRQRPRPGIRAGRRLRCRYLDFALENGFEIVSKDSDFQQRSLLFGHPPKFIWLRVGNCPVRTTRELLRKHSAAIHTFVLNPEESHLMLP